MDILNFLKKDELNQIAELQNALNKANIINANLQSKYGKIIDTESELNHAKDKLQGIEKIFDNLNIRYKNGLKIYSSLKKETETLIFDLKSMHHGIYNPIFDYSYSDAYKSEINDVVERQKWLIKIDDATHCGTQWRVGNSLLKGQVMVKREKQLMIRAFNGECDALIAKVKWNNYDKVYERIRKSFEKINSLGKSNQIEITQKYFDLKIKELQLTHEYNLKLYKEKEEERARREEQREEEKALREIERETQRAEQEEQYYIKALKKVKKEIEGATGIKYEKLVEQIKYLETELRVATENKERALSMAEQTRRGYVYIISNIGSFGDNIYKIGMTRRLEPEDRIRELSNASVPFKYDIHAMLFSEDAPSLEALLHNEFDNKRVNRINGRKEFFQVTLDEIEQKVTKSGIKTEFIKIPEARDYRETLSIIEQLTNSLLENQEKEKEKYPDSLYDYSDVDEYEF